MATIDQILKVLKNERECIRRQGGEECPRNCDPITGCYGCDLILPDTDILAVYDFLIEGYETLQDKGTDTYTIKVKNNEHNV